MGAKPTKEDMENLATSVGRVRGLSKEDLAGCLASLSDMADTGIHTDLPEIRINGQPSRAAEATPMSQEAVSAMRRKMKRRLERQASTNEEPASTADVQRQLHLLDSLDSQDDSADWASMRRWLVWCLHNNLDDRAEEDDDDLNPQLPRPSSSSSPVAPSGRQLRRQSRFDHEGATTSGRSKLKLQTKSSSLSFDSDKEGGRSGQNSFDSSGAAGET